MKRTNQTTIKTLVKIARNLFSLALTMAIGIISFTVSAKTDDTSSIISEGKAGAFTITLPSPIMLHEADREATANMEVSILLKPVLVSDKDVEKADIEISKQFTTANFSFQVGSMVEPNEADSEINQMFKTENSNYSLVAEPSFDAADKEINNQFLSTTMSKVDAPASKAFTLADEEIAMNFTSENGITISLPGHEMVSKADAEAETSLKSERTK